MDGHLPCLKQRMAIGGATNKEASGTESMGVGGGHLLVSYFGSARRSTHQMPQTQASSTKKKSCLHLSANEETNSSRDNKRLRVSSEFSCCCVFLFLFQGVRSNCIPAHRILGGCWESLVFVPLVQYFGLPHFGYYPIKPTISETAVKWNEHFSFVW